MKDTINTKTLLTKSLNGLPNQLLKSLAKSNIGQVKFNFKRLYFYYIAYIFNSL